MNTLQVCICVLVLGFTIFALIVNRRTRKKKSRMSEIARKLLHSNDSAEALSLLRIYTREELGKILDFAGQSLNLVATSFFDENLRRLRKAAAAIQTEKRIIKQMRLVSSNAISQLGSSIVLEKGLYYYQGINFARELVQSLNHLCEPILEHIENRLNPLDEIQKNDFGEIVCNIVELMRSCNEKLKSNNYENFEDDIRTSNVINNQLSILKREELKRIQNQSGSIKVSMVYLTTLHETQNVVTYTINLMKVSRKFQFEEELVH